MCKCRRVETTNKEGKTITGIVYCDECVKSGKAGVLGLQLLMASILRDEIKAIRKAAGKAPVDDKNVN